MGNQSKREPAAATSIQQRNRCLMPPPPSAPLRRLSLVRLAEHIFIVFAVDDPIHIRFNIQVHRRGV